MTMTNGNDSAYPITELSDYKDNDTLIGGLTKREYFAAKAMQGLLSFGYETEHKDLVAESVRTADALIEALNNKL